VNEMCDVVIIGAGQAGLSTSHELSRMNREHIILDRAGQDRHGGAAGTVLPCASQLTIKLAGAPYRGPDPMDSWLETRLWSICVVTPSSFSAPVREGVAVQSLQRGHDAGSC